MSVGDTFIEFRGGCNKRETWHVVEVRTTRTLIVRRALGDRCSIYRHKDGVWRSSQRARGNRFVPQTQEAEPL